MSEPAQPRPPGPDPVPGRDLNEALLNALFTESPLGLYLFDSDLRLIRMNTAARGWRGVAVLPHRGMRIGELVPGFDTEAIEAMLRKVLQTGDAVTDFEQRGFPPTDPTREYVASISAFRMQDRGGDSTLGVAAAVSDVTEEFRARNRVMLLNASGERIGSSLDIRRTAEEFARFAVPDLADGVTVDVFDCVLRGGAPAPGPVESHLPLRRVARLDSESDALHAEDIETGELFGPDGPSPYTQSLVDHLPRLIQQPSDIGPFVPAAPGADRNSASVLLLPLSARGVVLGVAVIRRNERSEPFNEDDLALAGEIADRTALSLDNARRYEREHAAARTLQRDLLPPALPTVSAVEAAYRYLPGDDAGGDWFDLLPLSGGRVAMVVGDVEGHGLEAATTMGRLRTAVSTLAEMDLPPDELLSCLDDLMSRMARERATAPGRPPAAPEQPAGASCLYVVYDPVSRLCTFARAGHPPPLLVRPDGRTQILDGGAGPPLGLGGLPFEAAETELPPGSLLALYTNGLIEGRRTSDDALGKLQHVLAHSDRSPEDSCDAVVAELLPRRPDDDAVLLLARTRSLGGDVVATWTLPAEPEIVATARALAGRQLVAWGLEELDFATELVVSELVTNAIRYSTGEVVLRLIRDGNTLTCEVTDNSTTAPHLRRSRENDEGGRGLFLVAQCTQRWGTRRTSEGKTIWAEQSLPPSRGARLTHRPYDPRHRE